MNPRDLRIGNYVHTDTIFNGMIESVSAYGKIYCWGRDENWEPTDTLDSYGHHRISPAPITEEWLKRLGFREPREPFKDVFWLEDYSYSYCIKKGCLCYGIQAGCNELTQIKIEHVHQLQNIYHALTGEEL